MENIYYKLVQALRAIAIDEVEVDNVDVDADTASGVEGEIETEQDNTSAEYDIDGEKFTLEQLREFKQGHMRQSDYTKKTQEVSNFRKENQEAIELYNFIRDNPEMARKLAEFSQEEGAQSPGVTDPTIQNMQTELFSMKLQTQLTNITAKDSMVNDIDLLTICAERGCDADEAYTIWRGQNFDKIMEKKMAEKSAKLTEDIKKNGIVTKTLASGGKITNTDATTQLSQAELDYCAKADIEPAEYLKWK